MRVRLSIRILLAIAAFPCIFENTQFPFQPASNPSATTSNVPTASSRLAPARDHHR
jgi:hypothetical protein